MNLINGTGKVKCCEFVWQLTNQSGLPYASVIWFHRVCGFLIPRITVDNSEMLEIYLASFQR